MDTVCVRAWDPASLVPPPFFARLLLQQECASYVPACCRECLGPILLRCGYRLLLRYPAAPMNLRRTIAPHHRTTVPADHCTTAC